MLQHHAPALSMFRGIGTYVPRIVASAGVPLSLHALKMVGLCGLVLGSLTFSLVPLGLMPLKPVGGQQAIFAAGYMVVRSVVEELIFRSAMLPHRLVDGRGSWQQSYFIQACILPIILFTFSHLISTRRTPGQVLRDPLFLFIAALVGSACSFVYWASGGSLAAASLMHFVAIYPWVVLLDGHKSLHTFTLGPNTAHYSGKKIA